MPFPSAKWSWPCRAIPNRYYIRNYSLWLDFVILLRTVPAVLSGRGAVLGQHLRERFVPAGQAAVLGEDDAQFVGQN